MGVSLTPVKLSPHSPLNGHTKTGFILQFQADPDGNSSSKSLPDPWSWNPTSDKTLLAGPAIKEKLFQTLAMRESWIIRGASNLCCESDDQVQSRKKWRNCLWIWVHQSSRFETKVLHKKNRKFYDLHPSSPILNVFICIGFSENMVYPKTWWLIMISEHSNGHELSLCPIFRHTLISYGEN